MNLLHSSDDKLYITANSKVDMVHLGLTCKCILTNAHVISSRRAKSQFQLSNSDNKQRRIMFLFPLEYTYDINMYIVHNTNFLTTAALFIHI